MRVKRNAPKKSFSPEKPKIRKPTKRNVTNKKVVAPVAKEVVSPLVHGTENTYASLTNVQYEVEDRSTLFDNQITDTRIRDEFDGFESDDNDSMNVTPRFEVKPSTFEAPSSSNNAEPMSSSSTDRYAPILIPSFMKKKIGVGENTSQVSPQFNFPITEGCNFQNVSHNLMCTPTRRIDSNSEVHSRTKLSSINNKWMPISFSEENFYDSINGVPLCQATIDENMKKLLRNEKLIDPSEFLQIASEMHGHQPVLEKLALGMVFMSTMLNKTLKRENHSAPKENSVLSDLIVQGNGFNLIQAKENETFVLTPSGRLFKMSAALNVLDASSYTSSKFRIDSKSILRKVFSEVAKHDPYFIACTPAENSSKDYVPFSHEFFHNVSTFIIKGFGQSSEMDVETYTTRLIRDTLTNLLDRLRAQYTSKTGRKVEEFASELKHALITSGTPQKEEIDFNAPSPYIIHSTT